MTSITLPFPTSVHKAFRRHNGKYLSEEYRKWRDEAGWMLKQQKPKPIAGPVCVTIDLVAPDKRRRDGDNYKKGPLDLLVAHGVIEADDNRIVKQGGFRWVESGAPCTVHVRKAE